jgi:hypothetical protein
MTIELIQKIIKAIADQVESMGPEGDKECFTLKIDGETYETTCVIVSDWTITKCDENDSEVPPSFDYSVIIYIESLTIHFDTGDFVVDDDFLGKEIIRS